MNNLSYNTSNSGYSSFFEGSYRYAYNGMETDNEVKGNGNSYTTEFRQYDPRLGRWLSLDPLKGKYTSMSPYSTFNNNPIYFVDLLGLEGEPGDENPRIYYNPNGSIGNIIILVPTSPLDRDELANSIFRSVKSNKLMKNSTFDIILASNIEFANELVDEYLKTTGIQELSTLVYNDHGGISGMRLKLKSFEDPETGEITAPEVYAGAKHIYGKGELAHVFAASELIKLLSKVGNGGNIIMAVCYIGYEEDIGNAIMSQPTINNVNLYLNGDLTTMTHTPNHNGPFEGKLSGAFLIKDENYDAGWRVFNRNSNIVIPEVFITNQKVGNLGVNSNGTVNVDPDFKPRDKFPSENEDGNR